MEVVAGNFEEAFPEIVKRINGCDYAAIDCEFTGLDLDGRRREEYFDDLDQRYARVRTSAQNFLVIQVGLSLFEWDATEKTYKSSTYNCYVYPRSNKAHDLRFTCQASSLEFLSKHNFDFNKFVNEGVPFLSLSVADQLYRKLEQESSTADDAPTFAAANGPIKRDIRDALKSDEDKQRHRDIIERVRQWLDRGSKDAAEESTMSESEGIEEYTRAAAKGQSSEQTECAGEAQIGASERKGEDNNVLLFGPMNSFWRAVVYQTLEREFGKDSFLVERVPDPLYSNLESLRLVRADRAAVLEAERARTAERRAHIDQAVGFSRVFRALSEAKKPVVGHNMLLDLAYTFQLFVQPLPSSFDEFRQLVSSFFSGGIYDTKHLALQTPEAIPAYSGTGLESVFSRFSSRVFAQKQAPSEPATIPLGRSLSAEPRTAEDKEGADRVELTEGSPVAMELTGGASSHTKPRQASEASIIDETPLKAAMPSENSDVVVAPPLVKPSEISPLSKALGGNPEQRSSEKARSSQNGSTGLPSRSGATDAMPRVEHAEGFDRYLTTDGGPPQAAHEAGYDAFMTGVAFLGLAKALEVRKERQRSRVFCQTVKEVTEPQKPAKLGGSTEMIIERTECTVEGGVEVGGVATRTVEVDTLVRAGNGQAAEFVTAEVAVSEVTFPAVVNAPGPLDGDAAALSNGDFLVKGATTAALSVGKAAHETGSEQALLELARKSPVSLEAVRRYAYRINLMYTDMPHLPLQGPLIIPERGHVFYLSCFAEGTRSPDLAGLFVKLGLGDIDITWIHRNSAFVALRLRTLANSVIEKITSAAWAGDIVTWADYRLYKESRRADRSEHLQSGVTETGNEKRTDEKTGHPTKGRKLENGQRDEVEQNEEDNERNERRLHKASVRRTCTIL